MQANSTILSVTDLTRRIKGVIEPGFRDIAVEGEISNFKKHTSGHLYFTLKDEHSQIQAVMWRSRLGTLFFTPEDGMKVVARGNVTVYEVRGIYQVDVAQLQPRGVGELQMAFERLKRKLAAEGLFSSERKKPLPEYPQRIGIVTSPTGAVLRDMLSVLQRRYPLVEVVFCPVKVQGPGAAEEIARAIGALNQLAIDVLIVGRGGGSLEDLWAFNEEVVARAIAQSRIPVVSAVGHEVDFTIADFVADLRAPTPSAAAEMVVPDRGELVEIVRNYWYTAQQIVATRLASEKEAVRALLRGYSFKRPFDLIRQYSQQLDECRRTLDHSARHYAALTRKTFESLQERIFLLNPEAVLGRGYAIVLRQGKAVGTAKDLHSDDDIDVRFRDGIVPATVR